MAVGSVASKALEKGTSSAQASYSSAFDSSGWNVSTGAGNPVQTSENSHTPVATTAGAIKSAINNPMMLVVIGLAISLYLRK